MLSAMLNAMRGLRGDDGGDDDDYDDRAACDD